MPDERVPYQVIDGVLLFDVSYHPDTTDAELHDTNDHHNFPVAHLRRPLTVAHDAPRVRFSVSHIAPTRRLPTAQAGFRTSHHPMYYNEQVDAVLRAHRSPLHIFGHTHEQVDATIDDVRYVNNVLGYDPPTRPIGNFIIETPTS